jgi:signal transduction histidine kinase
VPALNAGTETRDGIIQVLGHDIRTHVLAIHQNMDLLLKGGAGSVTGEQAEFLRSTLECCDVILGVTSDLVDLSRFESGELKLAPAQFDLVEAIQSSIRQNNGAAVDKGLRIIFMPASSSIKLFADRHRIIRVLVNLLWNAIKFSPEGTTIRVSCFPEEDHCTAIRISDEGPGIPLEEQESVFEKHYRVRNDSVLKSPGEGLGLYFCRQTVLAHGGRIWVDSPTPGSDRGTCVTFMLPTLSKEYV